MDWPISKKFRRMSFPTAVMIDFGWSLRQPLIRPSSASDNRYDLYCLFPIEDRVDNPIVAHTYPP